MTRISDNTLATIEFTLRWRSGQGSHAERFLARKVNLWRDIFPPGLREALEGREPGERVLLDYAPGQALPQRDASLAVRVPVSCFAAPTVAGRTTRLARGRFYPRGLFASRLPGVYPQDARPARALELSGDSVLLDLNHPLAGLPVSLEALVTDVAPKASDTGGRLSCWMEEIAGAGPGMQARAKPTAPTDFGGEDAASRLDETPDTLFYGSPRMTGHVDATASAHLRDIYAARLSPGLKVLDLMSSVQSHLPAVLGLHVTGLGLNAREMQANPALGSHLVQDLNENPALPFPDASFDAVTLSLSVEYLTRPRDVLREAARVLRPGGQVLIGFSNRWFPTKAVRCWLDMHEFERLGHVLELLDGAGGFAGFWTVSARNWWRPADDPHTAVTWTSDPVYVAGAERV